MTLESSIFASFYFYKKYTKNVSQLHDEAMQVSTEFTAKQIGKNHKYTILKEIGSGACGRVYEAKDEKYKDLQVAVKVQHQHIHSPKLIHQCNMYRILRPGKGVDYSIRIPHFYYCASQDSFNVFVMQRMGPTLGDILREKGKLPIEQVLYLAQQMISIIEYVHSKHILHRDLKPGNFCMGTKENSNNIFLIDFGLAKRFIFRDNDHIIQRKIGGFIGNLAYSSINAHNKIEQSRRDDLQSLGYIFIYMAKGWLPWTRIKNAKESQIIEMKKKVSVAQLCKELPISFGIYLATVRSLDFPEEPNYEFYKNLFRLSYKCGNFKRHSSIHPKTPSLGSNN